MARLRTRPVRNADDIRAFFDGIAGDYRESHGSADRLLRLLRMMAVDADAEADGGTSVRATQQQLADLLGVSRVTLGAALRDLTARGLVETGYGRIRLVPGSDRR